MPDIYGDWESKAEEREAERARAARRASWLREQDERWVTHPQEMAQKNIFDERAVEVLGRDEVERQRLAVKERVEAERAEDEYWDRVSVICDQLGPDVTPKVLENPEWVKVLEEAKLRALPM